MPRTLVDVLPIQETVASASPSAWRDGLVTAQADARLVLVLLDGRTRVLTTRAEPVPGEPVAFHPVAELLAVGSTWYAARPAVDAVEQPAL
jgi:hypothetical protein